LKKNSKILESIINLFPVAHFHFLGFRPVVPQPAQLTELLAQNVAAQLQPTNSVVFLPTPSRRRRPRQPHRRAVCSRRTLASRGTDAPLPPLLFPDQISTTTSPLPPPSASKLSGVKVHRQPLFCLPTCLTSPPPPYKTCPRAPPSSATFIWHPSSPPPHPYRGIIEEPPTAATHHRRWPKPCRPTTQCQHGEDPHGLLFL
jgi:hypothetical protein